LSPQPEPKVIASARAPKVIARLADGQRETSDFMLASLILADASTFCFRNRKRTALIKISRLDG
jgi:hypothetical protein